MNSFTDWIDPKNRKQCKWAISYLKKIPQVVFEPGIHDMMTIIETAFNCIPRAHRKERKRLMKAAWSQQNLKSDGKISCQYRLRKESVKYLKEIAKQKNKNLNETIENLIANEQYKVKKQKESREDINRQVRNISEEQIVKIQEKSQKKIEKLDQEVLKLKTIIYQTLIDNYQYTARLVSKERSGKLSEKDKISIEEKTTNTLLQKGVEIPEHMIESKQKPLKYTRGRHAVLAVLANKKMTD